MGESVRTVDDLTVNGILADVFGFDSFRPHQREIVEALLSGRDVFAIMPTGGGKSLCYQLPARVLPGTAVIVSPLISLMQDQVDGASETGLAAGTLNSSTLAHERSDIFRRLAEGRLDLLYVSPERLLMPDFLELLERYDISFFAIDEAHCVSEWGHDFRPDYLGLKVLAERFGKPVAAFTATATHRVADDIVERLGLRDPYMVRASFNRPNLFYQVAPRADLERQIMAVIDQYPDESGIIYRSTRKKVEETAKALTKRGLAVRPYHAGMPDDARRAAQDDFRLDRCRIIVATVAFGMGIDKSNVRFVIHGDLPKNLESYYQETGRAGRDGEPSRCAMFYGGQEMLLWRRFSEEIDDPSIRQAALHQLKSMIGFAQNDGCRRQALLSYFGENLPEENCGGCDVCCGEVERVDATIPAQMALSAMVRIGGRFGATHITDILMGADTARVRDFKHNLLPTYGVGREYHRNFWRDLINALVSKGLAMAADSQFPTLSATPRSNPVLRGEEKFHIMRTATRMKAKTSRAERRGLTDSSELTGRFSQGLLKRLKDERSRLAREGQVPPYVIFSDKTLREMAEIKPQDAEAFLAISGVGLMKLEKYGRTFITVIGNYLRDNPSEQPETADESKMPEAGTFARPKEYKPLPTGMTPTLATTGEMLKQGKTLAEVSAARGYPLSTIINHIEALAELDNDITGDLFFSAERLEVFRKAFEARPPENRWRLRPLVEDRELAADYDEVRLARIFLRPPDISAAAREEEKKRRQKGRTQNATDEMLRSGMSLVEVAAERGMGLNTVIGHLELLMESGADYTSDMFMTDERLAAFEAAYERLPAGDEWRPELLISDKNLCASFEEARLARVFLRSTQEASAAREESRRRKGSGRSAVQTAEMLKRGLTLEQVAAERGFSLGTIITHLEYLVASGEEFTADMFLPAGRLDDFKRINDTLPPQDKWQLSALLENTELEATYEEARLALIFLTDGKSGYKIEDNII
ncbi:DNA helicase RecQ [Deltaproteobacteria bacterium Smac51]|nr:DNA helicase RecQ [Deltaproteobacteria bacterium Smac51]